MAIKNNTKSKRGFTIIEVVLVLAVAGLIFMMVFLALPALQRSQRDTQRRDQLSGLITQITQYQANNRNKLPGTEPQTVKVKASTGKATDTTGWGGFYNNYLLAQGDVFDDPNGDHYTLQVVACGVTKGDCTNQRSTMTFAKQNYAILITYNSKCDGENIVYDSGDRRITVAYKLEGGGTFCQGN